MIQSSSSSVALLADVHDLPNALREIIHGHRDEAEAQRRLPRELTEALRDAGAFRLLTPLHLGGFEASLGDAMCVYEAFGYIDAPVAWNIWNGNCGFAAAMLDADAIEQIWGGDADPIIANSARVAGAATATDGGFLLSGRWDIVSAIDIADWVALFGVVMDGEGPRMLPVGAPDVRVFFVRHSEIEVLDTWHTTGMRGTGSNTVVADGVLVPSCRAISPFSPARGDAAAVYRIPAFTLASHGAASIVIGAAQAAIDAVIAMAPTKATDNGVLAERAHAQGQIGSVQMKLHAARLLLHDAAADIDAAARSGEPITEMLRARLRAAMSHAAIVSRDVLGSCQRLASSTAVYSGNAVERHVRDGITAAQHMILAETHLDLLGRLLFGLDAGTPII